MRGEVKIAKNISIITIYDNYQHNPELNTGWGFSCIIKSDNSTVLFDTGGEGSTLLNNMNITPSEVDIIFLSHIHGDHIGGLYDFLEKNSDVKVFVPISFPQSFENNVKSYGAELVRVSDSRVVCEGFYSTGEIGSFTKEQALIVNTKKGIVIITGCSHPGIVKIIKKAKEVVDNNVYLVVGGFHLMSKSDSELKNIINSFRELSVKKAAPCHCSGDKCRELFCNEYGEDFINNGVGKIIKI